MLQHSGNLHCSAGLRKLSHVGWAINCSMIVYHSLWTFQCLQNLMKKHKFLLILWKYVKIYKYTPFLVYCCTIVRDSNCFSTHSGAAAQAFFGALFRVESVMPLQELEFSSAANTSVIGTVGCLHRWQSFPKGSCGITNAASRKSETTSFRFHYGLWPFALLSKEFESKFCSGHVGACFVALEFRTWYL